MSPRRREPGKRARCGRDKGQLEKNEIEEVDVLLARLESLRELDIDRLSVRVDVIGVDGDGCKGKGSVSDADIRRTEGKER